MKNYNKHLYMHRVDKVKQIKRFLDAYNPLGLNSDEVKGGKDQ